MHFCGTAESRALSKQSYVYLTNLRHTTLGTSDRQFAAVTDQGELISHNVRGEIMDQENNNTGGAPALAEQLAQAAQSLANALASLDGHFAALHAKIDRIVAAVDEGELQAGSPPDTALQSKVAELEKANLELKAQSATARRKTLSPVVTALLAKEGVDGDALIETPIVEKALAGLSVEQRIAVKAELARAGILV